LPTQTRGGCHDVTSFQHFLEPEQLATLLEVLDPADFGQGHYDRWIRLAAACHDATAGAGLEEFADWCARDPEYGDVESYERVARHWASFEAGKPSGATYRTLLRHHSRPSSMAIGESRAAHATRVGQSEPPQSLTPDSGDPRVGVHVGEQRLAGILAGCGAPMPASPTLSPGAPSL
jgi:hypothetical protein